MVLLLPARVSKRILRGYVRKLMLTRGFQNIAQSHHRMNGERLFRPDGRVLHYKWTSIVLDHLAERIARRGADRRQMDAGIGALPGLLAAQRAHHLCRLYVGPTLELGGWAI
jgi:hypothetical protein